MFGIWIFLQKFSLVKNIMCALCLSTSSSYQVSCTFAYIALLTSDTYQFLPQVNNARQWNFISPDNEQNIFLQCIPDETVFAQYMVKLCRWYCEVQEHPWAVTIALCWSLAGRLVVLKKRKVCAQRLVKPQFGSPTKWVPTYWGEGGVCPFGQIPSMTWFSSFESGPPLICHL